MCGVVGFLNLDGEPASPVVLRGMTEAVAHRGPDGEGHVTDGSFGLGHRRLAIIDLSPAGHQPMQTSDGRYLLSYNGELYNFQELRAELESLGHRFHSRTDSEVVLKSLAQWGVDVLPRLNGMFAFALWDRHRRRLVLARDRYGVKPLYYALAGNSFLFSSEVKGLMAHPKFSVDVDWEGLAEYLTFQNFFTDRTLFAGVRLLPPGCHLEIEAASGARPSVRSYWDYDFIDSDTGVAQEEYLEELDRLLTQAVNRQLVSDVPVSSYLSGGMDSGSIAAIAARSIPGLRTFTVGFDMSSASGMELGFDERERAERMSYLLQTEHYEMVLKAGDMERVMPRLTWHLEEPRVGQSYPNFYAAQLAGKFAKVVLAGTGGDELFGGYPWRYYRAAVNDDFESYVDKYYAYWQRLISNTELRQALAPIGDRVEHVWTRDIFRNVFGRHADTLQRPEDYVNHSMYLEAKTFLHGLLVMEDKLSMAHGLETRVPFLDNELVDFALRLPVHMKLDKLQEVVRVNENEPGGKAYRYYGRTHDGKRLLRHVVERYVSTEVSQGLKQGFSAPDASWFKGESIDYVRRRLLGREARIFEFLDRSSVHRLVTDHLEGRQNRRLLIWSLLYLEQWCELFLTRERTAALI